MPPPHMPPGFSEKPAKKPTLSKELFVRIASYMKPYTWKFVIVLLVVLVSSILGIVPSILTGRMIDDGLLAENYGLLVELVILSLVLTVFSNVLGIVETYFNTAIAQGIIYDVKNEMYTHIQNMSYAFFTDSKQGEIITRMTEDVNGVQQVVSSTMTKSIKNVGTVVIAAVALFKYNIILAIVGIMIIPLFILPTRATGQRRWAIAREIQSRFDDSNQVLNDTMGESGALLVKLFNKQDYEYDRFKDISKDIYSLSIKETLTGKIFFITLNIFTNFGPLLIYLVGGFLMLRHPIGNPVTVGEITAVIALLNKMYRPVNELMNVGVDITRSLALFERIFEYLDKIPDIKERDGAIAPERIEGNIQYDNVSFHYKNNADVLKDVSFTLDKGKTFAFVGSSGAGKSTLISLLPRLYDVTDGAVLVDGTDVRDYTLSSLRENIGFVTQDTYLFNDSIKNNLVYAKQDATDEEIESACKRAGIYDFIMSLPKGFDTVVGNRGVRLSGGEKQRLSLARVILKDPPVLILDEATSSLDSVSESYIQEAIKPLLVEKTSLVVAHRLSTILDADEIFVVENGTIKEHGPHRELILRSESYQKFFNTQFKGLSESNGEL